MTREFPTGLGLISSMITPAVLISACGTLVFSTATRLARIVDRFTPSLLGIAGTTELFYGCVLLIREMRLSQRAVDSEMEFTLRLGALYQARHGLTPGASPTEDWNAWARLQRLFHREVAGKDEPPR